MAATISAIAVTIPCQKYGDETLRLVNYVGFISALAIRNDYVQRTAIEALLPGETDESKVQDYKSRLETPRPTVRKLREFSDLICQTTLCRAVDNFLTYLSELLTVVFTHRPEALKSRDNMKVSDILEHGSMEQLISTIAENRVHDLSYQGMRDMSRYLEERLSFELFTTDDDLSHATKLVEIRNVIVHNRGVVNSFTAAKNHEFGFVSGQTLDVDIDFVFDSIRFLDTMVLSIDKRAVEKFSIPQIGSTNLGQMYDS